MHRHKLLTFAVAAATLSTHPCTGQSRHQRKAQQMEESAQPKTVAGGVTFQTPLSIEKCFEAALNHLKRNGHDIELADREAGRIVTVMEVTGSHSQTGTRILATLIKDSDSQTSLRVAVTTQKRKRLLVTEPWSDPKVDSTESTKVAAQLQETLKAQ